MWLFYFINTFSFENEICCPNSFRIRQDIDTIAMLYSLACRIDQIVEIITLFANSAFSNGSNSNILSSIMVGFILSAKVVIKLVIIDCFCFFSKKNRKKIIIIEIFLYFCNQVSPICRKRCKLRLIL